MKIILDSSIGEIILVYTNLNDRLFYQFLRTNLI
jgi:hypothetical protein